MSNPKLSIIIVNYNVDEKLIECIQSIKANKVNFKYEIIIVDNSKYPKIEDFLKKEKIIYIKNSQNLGFSYACNQGAKEAKGEYLFFLNPDTVVYKDTINILCKFLDEHKNAAIASPLLYGRDNKPYPQGNTNLGVLQGIVCLSFLNKLLPNNPISSSYNLKNWDQSSLKQVDVVPGTAFVIRAEVFEKVGGLDNNFFLFFEEFDLCKRVRSHGYSAFIIPGAKVKHYWGESTGVSDLNIKKIFNKSRFYYFKKHYGLLSALIVNIITSFSLYGSLLIILLAFCTFLYFYKLNILMTFIGDQGWFYLSARDMLLKGKIPLVGITASHPWLHQGPLWTYILALVLFLFHFNPLSGAYFSASCGLISILLIYIVGKKMVSPKFGVLSAALFATSPAVINNFRMPYHTSLIPSFTIIFIYLCFLWAKKNNQIFPFIILILGILYNLELSTIFFIAVIGLLLAFKYFYNHEKLTIIFTKKILLYSLIGLILPLTPIIIYDITHGFPQTVKFGAWIVYRGLIFIGILKPIHLQNSSTSSMGQFLLDSIQSFLFLKNAVIAVSLLIISILTLCVLIIKKSSDFIFLAVIFLFTFFSVITFLVNQTPSGAYLPDLFPIITFVVAYAFYYFISIPKIGILFSIIFLLLISLNYIFELNNFIIQSNQSVIGRTFADRLNIAKEIVKESENRPYNLKGRGPGSFAQSFTMNYEYLTWWLGHAPSTNKEKLVFVITERSNGFFLQKEITR